MSTMYICVDFDGTVVDHRYPCVGDPVPLAVDWLQRWVELGAQIRSEERRVGKEC